MGAVTLTPTRVRTFIGGTPQSPAQRPSIATKELLVPAGERSSRGGDGLSRDERGEGNERRQANDAGRGTKHGPVAPNHTGWASGRLRRGNQSPP
jgi:hypothetical protein